MQRKKIILSNIKVHREQNPKRANFFNEDNFLQLSKIIEKIWHSNNESIEKKEIINSFKINEKKLRNYALDYQKIILNN